MVTIEKLPKTHKYIYDENIEPLFLGKDSSAGGGYILYLRKDVEQKNGKGSIQYAKVLGYPSTFSNALKAIARESLNIKGSSEYSSIREYIEEWEQIKQKMESLVDF